MKNDRKGQKPYAAKARHCTGQLLRRGEKLRSFGIMTSKSKKNEIRPKGQRDRTVKKKRRKEKTVQLHLDHDCRRGEKETGSMFSLSRSFSRLASSAHVIGRSTESFLSAAINKYE